MFKVFKKKDKSNFIDSIKKVIDDIKAMIDKNPGLTRDEYLTKGRINLNMALIQALIGAEIKEKKKDGKFILKFNKKLPDKGDIAEIVTMLNNYIGEVENPFLISVAPDADDSEDMGIPQDFPDSEIGKLDGKKLNGKKMINLVFGYDGKDAISRAMITATDCIKLAAVGEDLRKKQNRNKALIIGGIVLVVTAGTVAAVVVCNKKKSDMEEDFDIDDLDIDDLDIEDIDVDSVPEVEID